ncbi:MAG: hypothetical protein LBH53_00305, partial [Puniceicoccales bacterium]|nr:hypothetical protein [Puniceicoccales bacterium]
MAKRILGTFFLLAIVGIAIGALGTGGAVLLLMLLSLLSQAELCRLVERFSGRPDRGPLLFWTAAILLGSWYLRQPQAGIWLSLMALLWLLVSAVV